MKRVLAYSTVSQLGYMFLAMGVGAYTAGVFHLYTHAFFKALLFLGSGAVIHALHGEQDLRNMGGLKKELPITYWTFVIGALAIAGVPGLSGFFSKDEILFRTFSSGHTMLWIGGLVTSLLTAIYMFRLVFLAFHGERRGPVAHADEHHPAAATGHGGGHGHLHDAPPAMAVALVVLAIGSVLAGYVGVPHAIGGANRLEAYLAPSFTVSADRDGAAEPAGAADHQGEHEADAGTELTLMALSSGLALGGIGIAMFFFLFNRQAADRVAASAHGLRTLLLNKYYVDELYDATLVQPIRLVSEEGLWKRVDAGLIDGTVNGVATTVGGMSELLRRLQTGSVRTYAASLLFGAVLILGYYLWP
jgi:NADH-quinone oxidoreductase subunit L